MFIGRLGTLIRVMFTMAPSTILLRQEANRTLQRLIACLPARERQTILDQLEELHQKSRHLMSG